MENLQLIELYNILLNYIIIKRPLIGICSAIIDIRQREFINYMQGQQLFSHFKSIPRPLDADVYSL